jgi:P-type Mg2+ transporter
VIVKRLDAIQNLGAVSILCSDKTGTLTMDHVQVSTSMLPNGEESILPLKLAYLNSALQTGTRSPIDASIVDCVKERLAKMDHDQRIDDVSGDLGEDITIEEWEKLSEVPFDSTRRLLSVLVTRVRAGADEKGFLITKGAVEEVLDRCTRIFDESSSANLNQLKLGTDGTSSLTTDHRTQILERAERFNGDGLRLVAVACKSAVAMHSVSVDAEDENDLVFVGFLGFLDPLKPDAADAIAKLTRLGVQVGCSYRNCVLNIDMPGSPILTLMDCRFESSRAMFRRLLPKLLEISVFYPPRLRPRIMLLSRWSPPLT